MLGEDEAMISEDAKMQSLERGPLSPHLGSPIRLLMR